MICKQILTTRTKLCRNYIEIKDFMIMEAMFISLTNSEE
jgi:hypothetical protein